MASLMCSDYKETVDFSSVDTAVLRILTKITDEVPQTLSLLTQTTECFSCPLMKFCDLTARLQQLFVNTTFDTKLAVVNSSGYALCNKSIWFGERGYYNLTISGSNGNYTCTIDVDQKPIDSFMPILAAFLVYIALILIYQFGRFIRKKYFTSDTLDTRLLDEQIAEQLGNGLVSPRQKKERLRSLDTFRGISIVVMIFVNYGGGQYWFFNHSAWNGLTVADLVFPWFMFIMGTSMVLAFEGLTRRNVSTRSKVLNTIRRSVILFLLGILINSGGNPDLRTIRIFGVLQRFGVAYLIIGLVKSFTTVKKDDYKLRFVKLAPIQDVLSCWIEWVVVISLLIVWLCVTFLLPVPGCPTGYLGPGGISDNGKYYNCTGGAAGYVDRTVLTPSHTYQTPTCKPIYDTVVPYDPEGIMGCITSTFIVMLGLQAGQIVLFYSDWLARIKRWAIWALLTGAIAAVLCECNQNTGWIPINKNMWTLSYVLAMACFAYVSLIVLYVIVDLKKFWSGTPFYQAGMNSIFLYLGHEIMEDYLPFSWVSFTQTHWEYLFMNLWGASLWAVIAVFMNYKELYFTV